MNSDTLQKFNPNMRPFTQRVSEGFNKAWKMNVGIPNACNPVALMNTLIREADTIEHEWRIEMRRDMWMKHIIGFLAVEGHEPEDWNKRDRYLQEIHKQTFGQGRWYEMGHPLVVLCVQAAGNVRNNAIGRYVFKSHSCDTWSNAYRLAQMRSVLDVVTWDGLGQVTLWLNYEHVGSDNHDYVLKSFMHAYVGFYTQIEWGILDDGRTVVSGKFCDR